MYKEIWQQQEFFNNLITLFKMIVQIDVSILQNENKKRFLCLAITRNILILSVPVEVALCRFAASAFLEEKYCCNKT